MDIFVTVLEGEEDCPRQALAEDRWSLMSILSGCITVASAALADAGVDCVDLVTGGVAAITRQPAAPMQLVLDPSPSDSEEILAACVVAYLQSRDEITEIWAKGDITVLSNGKGTKPMGFETIVNSAVEAAVGARRVLVEAIKDFTDAKVQRS